MEYTKAVCHGFGCLSAERQEKCFICNKYGCKNCLINHICKNCLTFILNNVKIVNKEDEIVILPK